MTKKILFTTLCTFLFVLVLSAQQAPQDVIYLKNGSIFRGEIVEYKQGRTILFKLQNGDQVTLQESEVAKIVMEGNAKFEKARKSYNFKEKGFYNATTGGLALGTSAWSSTVIVGVSFRTTFGYKLNRLLGFGIGSGIDMYNVEAGEQVIPIFAEVRGYLQEKRITPFYALAGGYGFPLKNESTGISGGKGNYMVHPAVGLRLGGNEDKNATLDFGISWQKVTFFREGCGWWGCDIENEREYIYRRYQLRFGLLF